MWFWNHIDLILTNVYFVEILDLMKNWLKSWYQEFWFRIKLLENETLRLSKWFKLLINEYMFWVLKKKIMMKYQH